VPRPLILCKSYANRPKGQPEAEQPPSPGGVQRLLVAGPLQRGGLQTFPGPLPYVFRASVNSDVRIPASRKNQEMGYKSPVGVWV